MKLIRVSALPKGATKDGKPLLCRDGAFAQDYRDAKDNLYEQVTLLNGEIRIYRIQSGN